MAITRLFVLFFLVTALTSAVPAQAQEQTEAQSAPPAQAFDPYNPYSYNPYAYGWGGQGQEDSQKTEEPTGTRYWPYDPALRGLVPHPNLRGYGPGGDPRLSYDRRGEGAFTPGSSGQSAALLPPDIHLASGEEWKVPPSLDVSLDGMGGDAVLVLSAPTLTGLCGKMGPLEYTIENNTPWLDIRIKGYRVSDTERGGCKPKDHYLRAEIPLDRDVLEKTDQIRMTLGADLNTYTVRHKGDIFTIEPLYTPTVKPFVRGTDASSLAHQYTRNAIIALFVPAAATDEDVSQQISAFAARQGLTPLADASISMPLQVHGNRAWYFNDPKGGISRQIRGGPSPIGTIVRARTLLGPDGTLHESEAIDVYASQASARRL